MADGSVPPAEVSGRRYCLPSPDRRKIAMVQRGRISVRVDGRTYPVGAIDYGDLAWNPNSRGFAVTDSGGSGETSYFSYVDVGRLPPRRVKALRRTAVAAFVRRFRCAGPKVYVLAWLKGWEAPDRVRLVVQEGVHSEGCVRSDPEESEIGVVGDPATGRILRLLSEAEVLQAWCTPAERREYGLCYDERVARSGRR